MGDRIEAGGAPVVPAALQDVLAFRVEGFTLRWVAPKIRKRCARFLEGRKWNAAKVEFVDWQEHEGGGESGLVGLAAKVALLVLAGSRDISAWELGLDLTLPRALEARSAGWLEDVVAVVEFVESLRAETGRDFVIAGRFGANEHGEALFHIDADNPRLDREELKAGIGGSTGSGWPSYR
jgi:hypothetical protein